MRSIYFPLFYRISVHKRQCLDGDEQVYHEIPFRANVSWQLQKIIPNTNKKPATNLP